MPAGYCAYVLLNPEGKIYVGHTEDLERRLTQHNDPEYRGTLHTKRHCTLSRPPAPRGK